MPYSLREWYAPEFFWKGKCGVKSYGEEGRMALVLV